MQIRLSRLICINTSILLFLITAGITSAIPVFTTIGDKTVTGEQLTFTGTENEQLILTVYATDANWYTTIYYSAVNLPSGATFDPYTHTFSWTPAVGSAGTYNVKFIAESYGYHSYGYDSETVTITVMANVDKSELTAAIANANEKVDSAVAGSDIGQYPEAEIYEFKAAIDTAQEIVDDVDSTQTDVIEALSDLEAAEDEFDASKISSIDKSSLITAIAAANKKVDRSVAGTGVGQYPEAEIYEFEAAIDTAQEVVDDVDATKADVSKALIDLEAAEDEFDASKITSIDKSSLITAIAAANKKVDSAVAGSDIGQYPQAVIDEFEAAIDTAQEVVDDVDATEADVSEAFIDLKIAEDVFESSKITSIDKSALITAIAVAKIKVSTAVAGTDPGQYPQAAIDEFKATIDLAQAVAEDTGATRAEVNEILTDLQSAEAIFDAAQVTNDESNASAPVTNLQDSAVGSTWIRWTWTNPIDSDFSHVIVYIDDSFVTMTSNNYYESTGLVRGSTHSIGLKTVDIEGNVDSEMVVDSATTVDVYPEITTLEGVNITTTSITVAWESSNDTSNVEISRNGAILGTVNGSMYYIDSSLQSGTSYNYTLVPYANDGLKGEAVSVSLTTKSVSKSGGGGSGGSSSKKSSSSGGGGGSGSVEDFSNLAMKDVDTQYLKINGNVSYEFLRKGNPIQSIRFYSLKNSGEKTSTIEVLNNRSKLVNSSPEGSVYKYVNIWVDKAGFATSSNIKDASICFKVNNSWIDEMGVSPAEVRLQRYNGTAWEVLPTTLESSNEGYTVFEAKTLGFSPFAITVKKTFTSTSNGNIQRDIAQSEELPQVGDLPMAVTQSERSTVWIYIMINVLAIMFAFGYKYFKKDYHN
ncbi:PGF-pre-PGF domain-containing protein [uncultured Methanomethylovorans sp.]|uniref:PGF-pre-PGF domain-containing protein n=1 Tax=uncultured Methanomethylovorans sp. TaxID=183759 RepID=UPI002AA8AC6D|nr:PGF-pre-PGF domain-containing protein [uncultured Methanomethylovorans sp.]